MKISLTLLILGSILIAAVVEDDPRSQPAVNHRSIKKFTLKASELKKPDPSIFIAIKNIEKKIHDTEEELLHYKQEVFTKQDSSLTKSYDSTLYKNDKEYRNRVNKLRKLIIYE